MRNGSIRTDPEAEITKLKDGRTHLAYKAEHAVDLKTGAVVAVTVASGAAGDTKTIQETLPQAGEHIAEVARVTNNAEVGERVQADGPREAVAEGKLIVARCLEELRGWHFRVALGTPRLRDSLSHLGLIFYRLAITAGSRLEAFSGDGM